MRWAERWLISVCGSVQHLSRLALDLMRLPLSHHAGIVDYILWWGGGCSQTSWFWVRQALRTSAWSVPEWSRRHKMHYQVNINTKRLAIKDIQWRPDWVYEHTDRRDEPCLLVIKDAFCETHTTALPPCGLWLWTWTLHTVYDRANHMIHIAQQPLKTVAPIAEHCSLFTTGGRAEPGLVSWTCHQHVCDWTNRLKRSIDTKILPKYYNYNSSSLKLCSCLFYTCSYRDLMHHVSSV